jgi:hypothetical protein
LCYFVFGFFVCLFVCGFVWRGWGVFGGPLHSKSSTPFHQLYFSLCPYAHNNHLSLLPVYVDLFFVMNMVPNVPTE